MTKENSLDVSSPGIQAVTDNMKSSGRGSGEPSSGVNCSLSACIKITVNARKASLDQIVEVAIET